MALDDPTFQITALKKELEEKEKNLILAAQIGKDLLEQNSELNIKWEESIKESGLKIEELKQENYALSLKLEAETKSRRSAESEVEHQDKLHQNELERSNLMNVSTIDKLNKKISSQEKRLENLQSEVHFNEAQIEELQRALQENSDKVAFETKSIFEHTTDDESILHLHEEQIGQLVCEKNSLEKEVSNLTFQLKSSQHQLEKSKATEQSLSSELEERECELTTQFNALQKSKDEIQELQVEIETMKLQQLDPNRKGNSIFAEVDDNRKILEQKLLSMKEKFSVVSKRCEIKTQQIAQMKLQIASLLLLDKSEMEQSYLNHLEENLYQAQKQLKEYADNCQQLKNKLELKSTQVQQNVGHKEELEGKTGENDDSQNFFKSLYYESRAKICEMESEMEHMRFSKISLSDQLHQIKRKAFVMERERDSLNAKLIQLNVQLDELRGNVTPTEEKKKSVTTKTEILPFYEEIRSGGHCSISLPSPPKIKLNIESHGFSKDKKSREFIQNKENRIFPTSCTGAYMEKKPKKSVKLTETVQILEETTVTECSLKDHDGGNKPKKVDKVLRKVEAPRIDATQDGPSDECKQQ